MCFVTNNTCVTLLYHVYNIKHSIPSAPTKHTSDPDPGLSIQLAVGDMGIDLVLASSSEEELSGSPQTDGHDEAPPLPVPRGLGAGMTS